MAETAQIDKEALEYIAANAAGPYGGMWHKPEHQGTETCAGCAIEAALKPEPTPHGPNGDGVAWQAL